MVSRLNWTQTGNGWSSGRYRIELAAPKIWVLTEGTETGHDTGRVRIIKSAPSVRWLKHVASRTEATRLRRRMLSRRLAWVVVAFALLQIGMSVTPVLVIPGAALLFAVTLRAIVSSAEAAWDGAWARISETYQ